jgi:hypothetical protein
VGTDFPYGENAANAYAHFHDKPVLTKAVVIRIIIYLMKDHHKI